MEYDKRHGGPFDRGSADNWYGRPFAPHYFLGGTGKSLMLGAEGMTEEEIAAYAAGWADNETFGGKKGVRIMTTNFHVCPVCGSTPMTLDDFCGGFVIWCDQDDCTGSDIQAWDKNPAYAAEKWEQRCSLGFEAPDA